MSRRETIINTLKVAAFGIALTLAFNFLSAATWQAPGQNPPLGNFLVPLDEGLSQQVKTGPLQVGGLSSDTRLIVPTGSAPVPPATLPSDVRLWVGDKAWITSPTLPIPSSALPADVRLWVGGGKVRADDFCLNGSAVCLSTTGGGTANYANFVDFPIGLSVFVVPPSVTKIRIQVWGGGGGGGGGIAGGNGRGGGGAGGYVEGVGTVVPGQGYRVRVGSGGTGGVCGATSGTAGALSGVNGSGIFLTVIGGGGASNFSGGAGGGVDTSGSPSVTNIVSYVGGSGVTQPGGTTDPIRRLGGNGGSIFTSSGGLEPHSTAGPSSGTYPGAGGTGGAGYATPECTAGNGADGRVIIWW